MAIRSKEPAMKYFICRECGNVVEYDVRRMALAGQIIECCEREMEIVWRPVRY